MRTFGKILFGFLAVIGLLAVLVFASASTRSPASKARNGAGRADQRPRRAGDQPRRQFCRRQFRTPPRRPRPQVLCLAGRYAMLAIRRAKQDPRIVALKANLSEHSSASPRSRRCATQSRTSAPAANRRCCTPKPSVRAKARFRAIIWRRPSAIFGCSRRATSASPASAPRSSSSRNSSTASASKAASSSARNTRARRKCSPRRPCRPPTARP